MQKRSEGPMWPELVMGDRRGEYVMSDEQAALIHERLTYLTSEDLVGLRLHVDSSVSTKPFSYFLKVLVFIRRLFVVSHSAEISC